VKVHLKKIASDNVPQGLGRGSMGSTEEPERKRRHLNHHHPASPPLKKPAITSASDEKKVFFFVFLVLRMSGHSEIFEAGDVHYLLFWRICMSYVWAQYDTLWYSRVFFRR
jgi:hypothetical protein